MKESRSSQVFYTAIQHNGENGKNYHRKDQNPYQNDFTKQGDSNN